MSSRLIQLVVGLLIVAVAPWARAEIAVEARSADGAPGMRAFVELVYHYGTIPGVNITGEGLDFNYPSDRLTFVPGASSINLFATQSLPEYVQTLSDFAATDNGSAQSRHVDIGGSRKRYVHQFFTVEIGQPRSGDVLLKLAFDVHPTAPLGFYPIVFPESANVLIDDSFNESFFVSSAQSSFLNTGVSVSAIPEPKVVLTLLPGLLLTVLYARRRGAARTRARSAPYK